MRRRMDRLALSSARQPLAAWAGVKIRIVLHKLTVPRLEQLAAFADASNQSIRLSVSRTLVGRRGGSKGRLSLRESSGLARPLERGDPRNAPESGADAPAGLPTLPDRE